MDNRNMESRGFTELTNMTDHEFAEFSRKHDLSYRHHLISTVWTNRKTDEIFAVITYDNEKCTRRIFVKSHLV